MGVKGTKYISRESLMTQMLAQVMQLSDADLEEAGAFINDLAEGGEGFENYVIGEEENES